MLLLNESTTNDVSDGLMYHLNNSIPLYENIYRPGSKSYFELIYEVRALVNSGIIQLTDDIDEWLINDTDLGEFGLYEGGYVLLDVPMLVEAEYKGRDVELGKPSRSSGPKKYKVYVKNKKGNVIKVNFGDVKGGLRSKIHDPEARRDFANRHDCEDKKDRTTPGYWSCNLPRYASLLGLGKNMNTFW